VFLNLFTECSPSPQFPGLWRHPEDLTATGYRSLAYWTSLALRLEAACIDALFFADTHGVFDVYRGSAAPAVRHAVQIPAIDPVLVLPIVAAATRHLGMAVTYSTTYHAPFECARVFSSLDHLTGGRVAWNIVTSYLQSASENGLGDYLPHDVRYDRAEEYLAIVRALWESSWEDEAVVRDGHRNLFADASKVHEINHRGRWFSVRGPHQCEPSPQRTPVLYQAGASERGSEFAARHAEVVFVTMPDPASGAAQALDLRRRAAKYGRASLKILQGSLIIVGRDNEEAKAKAALFAALASREGEFAKWCGWTGFDLAGYADDVPVADIRTEASQSVLQLLRRASPERAWTVADLRYFVSMGSRPRRRNGLFGTPAQVADRMEEWMSVAGIDGFNLLPFPPSPGIEDICELLIPELQRRGIFRTAYDAAERTLRERYFGAGNRNYDSWAGW
jgi:FMN-dependent oxidoreductase (nitrilotriacetate monooxygenase family)